MLIKTIKNYFFRQPNDKTELLKFESIGFQLVGITFLLSSVYTFQSILSLNIFEIYKKDSMLAILLLISTFSFLLVAVVGFIFARKVLTIKSFKAFKLLKKKFWYFWILYFAIPYLLLTLWLSLFYDLAISLKMITVFIITVSLVYFLDWRKITKSSDRYNGFFNL